MPQFILKIDLGKSQEMISEIDIAEAVHKAAQEVYDLGLLYHRQSLIKDRIGNVVGHYEVVDS